MAELVQHNLERSMVEFEKMKLFKIFEDDELREIIRKREDFEYAVSRQDKSLKTYLEYISFERNVATICAERRRNDMGIELEHSILSRVKGLYEAATKRFHNNERLWDNYFMFLCKINCDKTEMSNMLDRMLVTHPYNPATWLKYTKWERNANKDIIKAKNLITRGIQNHPKCIQLYIELLNIETVNLELANDNQQIILDRITQIYEAARDALPGIESCIAVLDELSNSQSTESLQQQIIKDMQELYSDNELYFHTIAQREFDGLSVSGKTEGSSKLSFRERIENGVSVYVMAVKEVNTLKMWEYYLDAMVKLAKQSDDQTLKKKLLGKAFKQAVESNHISEAHYISYIEMLNITKADEDIILNVIKKGHSAYPNSVKLWESYIKYFIVKNDMAAVQNIFKQSKKLEKNAVPIWELYLVYLKELPETTKKIEEFFEHVVLQMDPAFNNLKEAYVEWAHTTGGLNYARTVYKRTIAKAIPCLEMHYKMAEYESLRTTPDVARIRNCHELACNAYGEHRTDVWQNYRDFEIKYGTPKNASNITLRGTKALKTELKVNLCI